MLEQDAAKRAAAEQASQNAGAADMRPAKFFQGRRVGVDCSKWSSYGHYAAGERGPVLVNEAQKVELSVRRDRIIRSLR